MNVPLAEIFTTLASRYTPDSTQVQNLWREIESFHTETHRYYHTLAHLAHLYAALQPVWYTLEEPDAVLFALFYHDSIYDPQSVSNEEESAVLARRRMGEMSVPAETIQKCNRIILATKSHQNTGDSDTNLFTDADLSILGSSSEDYAQYAKAVRGEYAIYNDAVYAAGRAKVLAHFLGMDRIFKTAYFFDSRESPARRNLKWEINEYI
jgi:predicted metal-dependent HD superfamily phosphohydrolase